VTEPTDFTDEIRGAPKGGETRKNYHL